MAQVTNACENPGGLKSLGNMAGAGVDLEGFTTLANEGPFGL